MTRTRRRQLAALSVVLGLFPFVREYWPTGLDAAYSVFEQTWIFTLAPLASIGPWLGLWDWSPGLFTLTTWVYGLGYLTIAVAATNRGAESVLRAGRAFFAANIVTYYLLILFWRDYGRLGEYPIGTLLYTLLMGAGIWLVSASLDASTGEGAAIDTDDSHDQEAEVVVGGTATVRSQETRLLDWHVEAGETVEAGQRLAEIEMGGTVRDLSAPFAGTLVERSSDPGASVSRESDLAIIERETRDDGSPRREPVPIAMALDAEGAADTEESLPPPASDDAPDDGADIDADAEPGGEAIGADTASTVMGSPREVESPVEGAEGQQAEEPESTTTIPEDDVDALCALLESDDPDEREAAAVRLGEIAAKHPERLEAVRDALRERRLDPSPAVSEAAADALDRLPDGGDVG